MIPSDAEVQILLAHWGKVLGDKAGSPVEQLIIAARITELAAELKARREKK